MDLYPLSSEVNRGEAPVTLFTEVASVKGVTEEVALALRVSKR